MSRRRMPSGQPVVGSSRECFETRGSYLEERNDACATLNLPILGGAGSWVQWAEEAAGRSNVHRLGFGRDFNTFYEKRRPYGGAFGTEAARHERKSGVQGER